MITLPMVLIIQHLPRLTRPNWRERLQSCRQQPCREYARRNPHRYIFPPLTTCIRTNLMGFELKNLKRFRANDASFPCKRFQKMLCRNSNEKLLLYTWSVSMDS